MKKSRILSRTTVSALVLAGAFCAANAAVVTTPTGTLVSTTPNPGESDSPPAIDQWQRVNVRTGSSIGITADYPRNSTGSALLTSSDPSGKADWQYLSPGNLGTLSQFQSGTYDWYRDSSSTTGSHLHPVYRLIIDIDGNPSTQDIAYLIYERAYQPGLGGAVPAGTWTTEAITPLVNMWVSEPGVGIEEVYNRPLSAYMDGSYTPSAGWTQITGDSVILGIQVGIGSGWANTFRGATDNIGLTAATTLGPDNFEVVVPQPPAVTAVPTLDIWGLLGLTGLLGAVAAWRRKQR